MSALPAGLTDPLHILEPWPWREALAIAAVALFLGWFLWRWWKRASEREVERLPPPVPRGTAFEQAVASIRERAHETTFFRWGCHDLAALLRSVVVARHGQRLAYSTARELAAQLENDAHVLLLVRVSDARFGRRIPDQAVLDELCDRALELDAPEWS